MLTNDLSQSERIEIGKGYEAAIIKLLNKHRPVVCHTVYDKWIPASQEEDMHDKIDAWATSGLAPTKKSVQIKYRESGGDLGIALIRPFVDFNTLVEQNNRGDVPFDRDFVGQPDFYAYLAGNVLCVVEGEKVKKACNLMLGQFVAQGGFKGHRSFSWPAYGGAELRLVKDKGAGYSQGQEKIICYLAPSFIRMAGGYVAQAN